MPPQRNPLGAISGNRQQGQEMSPYQRGIALGMRIQGASKQVIADILDCSRGALRSSLSLDPLRNEGTSLPRTGRPKSYTEADERLLLRHVRLHPKDTYKQVILACGLSCSRNTVKKILKEHGILNWVARRRPFLTEKNAADRVAWCLRHRYTRKEEWGMYMWSDECSVERGRGKNTEWVFRTANQKWDKDMIQIYNCHKNMKVMVWGCFWDYGRTNLYIIDRDFESLKHGYSANSYLEVLDAEVALVYENLDPGYIFMQDNASIHTAYKVQQWFLDHGIERITDWPPYSPDLNPIEHVWWELKKRVYEMFPEIAACTSETEHARQQLESALQAAWDTIDKALFDKLGESICDRIQACIEADGWHTKY